LRRHEDETDNADVLIPMENRWKGQRVAAIMIYVANKLQKS
jgi:hypothetical protein